MGGRGWSVALVGLCCLFLAGCAALNPTPSVPSESTPNGSRPTPTSGSTTTSGPAPTSTQGDGGTPTAHVKLRPVVFSATPEVNPNAQKGGEYRYLASAYPSDLGVWEGSVANLINGLAPLNDTLLEFNAWEEVDAGQLLPNVAYDYYSDATGLKWTFLLNRGVLFHDGVELNCGDVEFMLETIRDGKDPTGAQLRRSPRSDYLRRVKDVACPDPYMVVVTTDGPLPLLPTALALGGMVILPRHVFEGRPDLLAKRMGPGLGPFKEGQTMEDQGFTLVRNENYWNSPFPYLDQYAYLNMGSTQAVRAAFQVGRGEHGVALPFDTRRQLEQSGVLRPPSGVVSDGGFAVQANWKRAPWSDPRFSLALRCAIDSRKLIDMARSGAEYESPVFPLASLPGGSEWSLSEEEWLAVHHCQGPTAMTNMEQRRQTARDLLTQLGFSVTNPARPKTFLWDTFVAPQWPVVLEDLEMVGIFPEAVTVDAATGLGKSQAGDFDINFWAFMTPRADPDMVLYDHYHSAGAMNFGGYSKAELDALIDAQSRELDPGKRGEIVKDASRMVLSDNAKIWAYWFMDKTSVPTWVMNYHWTLPSSQNTPSRLTRAWIDSARMRVVLGQ